MAARADGHPQTARVMGSPARGDHSGSAGGRPERPRAGVAVRGRPACGVEVGRERQELSWGTWASVIRAARGDPGGAVEKAEGWAEILRGGRIFEPLGP